MTEERIIGRKEGRDGGREGRSKGGRKRERNEGVREEMREGGMNMYEYRTIPCKQYTNVEEMMDKQIIRFKHAGVTQQKDVYQRLSFWEITHLVYGR